MTHAQPETTRVCSVCGLAKPIDDFPFSVSDRYRRKQCKPCYSKLQGPKVMQRYHENKAEILEKRRNLAEERRRLGIKPPKRIRKNMEHYLKKKRQADTQRLDALRRETFNAYGGCACACCGEKQLLFLTLDHIQGGGSIERRKIGIFGGHKFYKYLRGLGYPPGYQVLCQNCNIGKHRNGGICPHHGTSQ